MSINLKFILSIIAIFILGIATLLWLYIDSLKDLNVELKNIEYNRHEMFLKADELRQHSDDLTKFARMFVVTGKQIYKDNYHNVLAIRNGLENRPKGYEQIYWDLTEPTRSLRHPLESKRSLKQSIQQLPFSENEFKKLAESEKQSNLLVHLEEQAFNAMDGLFIDEGGQYKIQGDRNQQLAIKLLYSDEYMQAKHSIMLPIDEFMVVLNDRTKRSIATKAHEISALFSNIFIALSIGIISFVGYLFLMLKTLHRHYREFKTLSRHDPLTKIRNRRSFFELSQQILTLAKRTKQPLSLIMIDIDNFKHINDTYGHIIGDEILIHLVHSINTLIRESDIFARFGGEEFIILLPETDLSGSLELCEKIRTYIENTIFSDDKVSVPFTISLGTSELQDEKLLRELIQKADAALYQSKSNGRNLTTSA
jgi:diguanylate cyclase (GGDEF)-like protein